MSVNNEILGWEIVKAEEWKILRNGEILVMGDHFEIGELIPLYGPWFIDYVYIKRHQKLNDN